MLFWEKNRTRSFPEEGRKILVSALGKGDNTESPRRKKVLFFEKFIESDFLDGIMRAYIEKSILGDFEEMSKVNEYDEIRKGVEKVLSKREEITNRRGTLVIPRKHHMTDTQVETSRTRWAAAISVVSKVIKSKVDPFWFNPYRANGAYYGGVQALFLLGGNKWHGYGDVAAKMAEDMSCRFSSKNSQNSWEKFAGRAARNGAVVTKDLMGRIVQNFRTLQRLGGCHPYGLKLQQLKSTVDIKREKDGKYYFRLNTTWSDMDSAKPVYDVSAYRAESKAKKEPKGVIRDVDIVTESVTSEK